MIDQCRSCFQKPIGVVQNGITLVSRFAVRSATDMQYDKGVWMLRNTEDELGVE